MSQQPVIAIFDVGKTNKKLFLFDERYQIVYEKSARFTDIPDEDGDASEDLSGLIRWIFASLREVSELPEFNIKAINFSAYGASFVYVDASGNILAPLYNYLKAYPNELQQKFNAAYGDLSLETASPALGSLNSGLQLYRLKHQKPDIFKQVKHALHLPQYLSYLLTGKAGFTPSRPATVLRAPSIAERVWRPIA